MTHDCTDKATPLQGGGLSAKHRVPWYKASAPRQTLAVTAREIFSHVASMPALNHPTHFGDGPFPAVSQSVERLGCRTPGNRTSILVGIQLLWERPFLVRYYLTGEEESQL